MSSKPTPGPVTICHTLVSGYIRGFSITAAPHGSCDPICASDFRSERSSSEIEANARLIKEAFDTATETGLTPQQLREMVKELSDTLLKLRPLGGSECFVRKGDGFYVADTRYFAQLIEQERVSTHEARKGKVRAEKQRDEFLAALERIAFSVQADTAPILRGYAQDAIAKVEGRS